MCTVLDSLLNKNMHRLTALASLPFKTEPHKSLIYSKQKHGNFCELTILCLPDEEDVVRLVEPIREWEAGAGLLYSGATRYMGKHGDTWGHPPFDIYRDTFFIETPLDKRHPLLIVTTL